MSDLVQRIESSILSRRLLRRGQSVLIAVSGGMDSMVLLNVLAELAPRHGWRLVVAHFNHQLRGRSSDADAAFVRRAATRLKLPCLVGKAEVGRLAREQGLSIEMAARRSRHAFLARAARRGKIRAIALAHHADDQVELFFLRLLRGAGGQGLAGMKWISRSPASRSVSLIRPLLDCSKTELMDFARANRIRFREDATNASPDFLRNRVRHELLPLLTRRFQPALARVVLRQMEILGAESDAVKGLVQGWRESGGPFVRLPVAVQRRILQEELIRLGLAPEFDCIERLREHAGIPVSVAPEAGVVHDGEGNLRRVSVARMDFDPAEQRVEFKGRHGAGTFAGMKYEWHTQAHRGARRPRFEPGCEWFDADALGPEVILRHWRPGDRFKPSGMKHAVKLQDLFTNAKIPRENRSRLVVAATVTGEIWWVEGLRIGEQFKLTATTQRRLRWRWRSQGG